MLHHPSILRDLQIKGDKIRSGYRTSAFSEGPKEGGNATSPLHSRGFPNIRGQNQKWLPHRCLLGGPQVCGNARKRLLENAPAHT